MRPKSRDAPTAGASAIRFARVNRSISILLYAIAFFAICVLNFALLSVYTDGDLFYYRNFYTHAMSASLGEIPRSQLALTGSGEPLYGYLVWAAAHAGIPHDVFFAILNVLLLFLVYRILVRYSAPLIFSVFAFSNYYLLVLLTGAERLKVAFIVIAAAALAKRRLSMWALAALSPIAHMQMVAHVGALMAARLPRVHLLSRFPVSRIILITVAVIAFAPLVAFTVYIYGDVVYAKLLYYSAGAVPIWSLAKLMALAVIGLVALRTPLPFLLAIIVLLVCTYVAESDRFQISALALLAYFSIKQGRAWHPAILAIMAYFSYKSVGFMMSVFEYGHGFGHVAESFMSR